MSKNNKKKRLETEESQSEGYNGNLSFSNNNFDSQFVNNSNNNKDPIKSLPTREYIQATVSKELTEGMLIIAQTHPDNPVEFLGKFLIERSKKK